MTLCNGLYVAPLPYMAKSHDASNFLGLAIAAAIYSFGCTGDDTLDNDSARAENDSVILDLGPVDSSRGRQIERRYDLELAPDSNTERTFLWAGGMFNLEFIPTQTNDSYDRVYANQEFPLLITNVDTQFTLRGNGATPITMLEPNIAKNGKAIRYYISLQNPIEAAVTGILVIGNLCHGTSRTEYPEGDGCAAISCKEDPGGCREFFRSDHELSWRQHLFGCESADGLTSESQCSRIGTSNECEYWEYETFEKPEGQTECSKPNRKEE